ncbi:CAAX protease [Streptococcus sp. H31]|uniref:CAAX protease n=1 Tax=Streptococcus huangxiaojuni TaxID=3237239 RepID=UPI0034A35BD2
MLLKLMITNRLGKKITENDFRKNIFRISFASLSLSFLGILFLRHANLSSSFAKGMVVGIIVSSFIIGLNFQWIYHHPQKLHRMYIDVFDERNITITSISAQLTLQLLTLITFLLLILSTFADIKLTYDILLITLVYLLTFGFVFLHWLISKII